MSTNPSWRPNVRPNNRELPKDIKYPLARRYMNHDGSLSGEVVLTRDDLPYLEGLADAGPTEVSKGARTLIDAIREHLEIVFVID